jgi:2-amino-4-hydroxy-6-hydroxymethyldihydropteridine diphosphokinase
MDSTLKGSDLNLDDAVVVALGCNLAGEFASCEALLEAALARFPRAGLPVIARSGWWRSAAWPEPTGPEYRNGIALVEPNGPPKTVLEALFSIERAFGRNRGAANAPRTLDLDLIAYGREVIDAPGLSVPHPRAPDRLFVMGPLAEIAPGWRHPVSGRSAAEMAAGATVGTDARATDPKATFT